MASRIRRGDLVVVITGNDRGKRGRVLQVIPDKGRCVVEGVNLVFKHLRKSQDHPQGGRIRRESPVPLSNVQVIDPETNTATRVRIVEKDGRRVRVTARSGALLDGAPSRKRKSTAKAGKDQS